MANSLSILYIGDIIGKPGRNAVRALLPQLREEYKPDLVFANAENMAGGLGLTLDKYNEMREVGIDYFTTGNHIWVKKEILPHLDDPEVRVLRPANYPDPTPGRGVDYIKHNGQRIQLINLIGRAFMKAEVDNYFDLMDKILSETEADIRIVDFHAEATSEKVILAYYLDGKVSAVLGTHTHVPTADERILPNGTAFQTDLGMVGPIHSSLGAKLEPYTEAARTGARAEYHVASGPVTFNSTLIEFKDGKAVAIERIQRLYDAA